jgi:hypothetical protein
VQKRQQHVRQLLGPKMMMVTMMRKLELVAALLVLLLALLLLQAVWRLTLALGSCLRALRCV